ncbi:type VI secretion system tip protein VgrG [Chitinophaga agrisoli]|uniref:Type VI secretion system tip protein VgrG n=1 Tax=Chitinophaga agrisoli TaxID=2607653 RepID=A0A5B2VNW6_9BACT|nr:type VI secretion system tip protein VgrG [Chitinophaga agrisoli]KAA2240002.1 type VI secretion system tip protein VgrG [Chitinophaga agrisoli]
MPGIIPTNVQDPTLRVTVTANGTAIQDQFQLVSIQVHHEINRISWAELVLLDGTTTETEDGVIGDFPASESDNFVPGAAIVVTAGYGVTPGTQIFSGIIVKQAIQARENGTFTLTITCKHKAVKMTINKKDAVFMNQLDSAVMSTLIGNYGLSATVTATSDTYETMFQKFATDWDFLLARAEFNGYLVTLGDDAVTVAPPAMSGAAVLTVGFGQSMNSFQAEMSAERQAESLTAKAWDPQTLALLESSGTEPTLSEQGNLTAKTLGTKLSQTALTLVSNSPLTTAELKTWADSTLLRMRLQAIRGKVSFMGNASAAPNTILELSGVGARFDGSAYITAVTHMLKDGEWETTCKFGLDSTPIYQREQFSYEPANGQLPAIHGLQLGEVVSISSDPNAEYRVQVKMGSTADGQTGTWARMASYYATAGSGNVFYPEVGDEVVIGFVESDPRFPVILGSLFSKGKTPPITPADNTNANKGLYTKSKMKITFDETNKIITIATPGGNSITMDDTGMSIEIKDMNSNSIKTSASGVEITSAANVMIKATGSITLNGTGGVTVTSPANVAVNGMNINQSATAALSATGASSATLSSGGVMTIMGATVMIN